MKPLVLHLLTAGAAAAAGWFAGLPAAGGDDARSRRQIAVRTDAPDATAARAAEWKTALAGVRRAVGATSEPAWIRWALSIPDADVPAAIARLNPRSDFHALRCLYARWTRLDPAAAWASFLKSDITEKRIGFYLPYADQNRGQGMVYSRLHETPRSLIAGRMLATWMDADENAARAFAARLRDASSPEAKAAKIDPYELDRVTGEKAADPAAGVQAAAALALEDSAARGPAVEKAVNLWMNKDPAAACRWITELPADLRKQLRFEYFSGAAREASPADRAQTFATMLQERNLSEEDLRTVAASAGKEYYDHSGDQQGVFYSAQAARQWAASDPGAAQAWLAAQPDNDLTAVLTGATAAGMVGKDPAAALALLNAMPGDQSLAVRPVMQEWVNSDARAAIAWAEKIDDAPLRDTSLEMAGLALAAADPGLALETARTITSEEARRRIYGAVRTSVQWNPAGLQSLREQFPGDAWSGPGPGLE